MCTAVKNKTQKVIVKVLPNLFLISLKMLITGIATVPAFKIMLRLFTSHGKIKLVKVEESHMLEMKIWDPVTPFQFLPN